MVCHNLEDGMELLRKSRKIKAVILDGRCILEPGQQQGMAKSNFVFHGWDQIKEIEHDFNRNIPFCVNTEIPDDFIEDLEGITRVFKKNNDHHAMFQWLSDTVEQLPETATRKEFQGIFELIDIVFNDDLQELLLDVIQTRDSNDKAVIVTNMARLRRLLESLVDVACLRLLGKQPTSFKFQHASRTRNILEAMHPAVLPPELYIQATQLYKTCSKYGNHADLLQVSPDATFLPGKYTTQRLAYSFIELAHHLLSQQTNTQKPIKQSP
jgi:hypothetical protein